jgi:hypothetical protein
MRHPSLFLILGLSFFLVYRPVKAQELKQRLFLVGDAGELENGKHPVAEKIKAMSEVAKSKGVKTDFLILGDNIYPTGMPEISDPERAVAEKILEAQLGLIKPNGGNMWLIPGNHDWAKGKSGGFESLLRQQAYVEGLYEENIQWLPADGCPGPLEVSVNDMTVMIAIDTQWWLHSYDKPGEESDCEFKTRDEVMVAVRDLFRKYKDKIIILAMHHPMETFGEHNGAYSWKDHLFPLTAANSALWIPLPVIGSIYPLYRTYFGSPQDMAHPLYKQLRDGLDEFIYSHPCVIIASGHDHSLQYLPMDNVHQIVAGSGSKATKIKKRNPLEFEASEIGFSVIDFYEGNKIKLGFYNLTQEGPVFEKEIFVEHSEEKQLVVEERTIPDSVKTPISYLYQANKMQKKFLGTNYRAEWQTTVPMRVVNLSKENGGLEVIKRGGGMQTKSLRVSDGDEEEYVLRSVEKYPAFAIPTILRQTVAKDIVQDQISASHPFASLVIPDLSKKVGVFHSDPELVWVHDDPGLGDFREEFGENVYLFERREVNLPDTVSKDFKFFSTDKMLLELYKDNDNFVDQVSVLRARLLDLLIGDWDRHDDQWRWVGFENEKGREFIPVPRDRDQAFFVNQGLLPRLASRKWVMPKFQGFDYDLRDINGFMFNGRYFDRSFLNGLSKSKWEETIRNFVDNLKEEDIRNAVSNLPKEIYEINGKTIEDKLIYRKSWLLDQGLRYYAFLAEEVDVYGSAKNELFEISGDGKNNIRVSVSKVSNKGKTKQAMYDRFFLAEETNEIRLFGLGGEDEFLFTGEIGAEIKIRLIGGKKTDYIQNYAETKKGAILIYQWNQQQDSLILTGKEKIIEKEGEAVFSYDRKAFQYDVTSPLPSLEYNVDDGFYLGAGIKWNRHSFRKYPYQSQQSFKANAAFLTGALNFYYDGHFVDVAKDLDLEIEADIRAPNYVDNFFGFGNETQLPENGFDPDFFRVRYNMATVKMALRKDWSTHSFLSFGPLAEYTRLDDEDNDGRFVDDEALSGLDRDDINQRKIFTGLFSRIVVDNRDSRIMPTRGIHFVTEAKYREGLNEFSRRNGYLMSDLSLYWTFREGSRFTWATRFGGGVNFGTPEFFQSQNLGGKTNLRGFRRFRFAGDAAVFNNTELRFRFLNFKTYLFPASSGLLFFHDVGRVWLKGETSKAWHNGYGFGLWVAPLNRLVIIANLGFGEEGTLPFITFRHQF